MKKCILVAAAILFCCGSAVAEPVDGTFKVTQECDAYVAFKKKSDPVKVKPGESYQAVEINKPGEWSWIRISVNDKPRWVEKKCGTAEFVADSKPKPTSSQKKATDEYLLSVSWQPAFCEAKSNKPECKSETEERFDATHFTLHGLWPQPNGNFYCGVPLAEKNKAESKEWCALPEVKIDAALRSRLDQEMPGTQSCLERYEWLKHGSCYSKPQQVYFEDALALLEKLNSSAVQKLFAENIGKKVTSKAIREAFDQSFGAGSGDKVEISCKDDGTRRLFVEMRIALKGDISGAKLAEGMKAAKGSAPGCKEGIVDPVGLQ